MLVVADNVRLYDFVTQVDDASDPDENLYKTSSEFPLKVPLSIKFHVPVHSSSNLILLISATLGYSILNSYRHMY